MIELITIVTLSLVILFLLLFIGLIIRNNDKQVIILTKALSAKNFSDMQHIEGTHTKQTLDNDPKMLQEEFVSLSDLSDDEADKIIKKQLELKLKK